MPSPEHEAMVQRMTARLAAMAQSQEGEAETEWVTAPPAPDDVALEETEFGGVPCLVVRPARTDPAATVVFLHGGGYIYCSPRTHLGAAVGLVRATGFRCVSVDYRLAPQHPFPAPVQDTLAVYRALLADGAVPGQICFAGDSAGGGLVLAGLIAARDAELPMPAAAVCVSPWTDLEITGASTRDIDDPIVTREQLIGMAAAYLAGAPARTPTASPLYADLRGLPPVLVQVGTREALLDDARRIAQRLREDDVDVTLEEFRDVIHMWVVLGPDIPESLAAFASAGAFLRRQIGL